MSTENRPPRPPVRPDATRRPLATKLPAVEIPLIGAALLLGGCTVSGLPDMVGLAALLSPSPAPHHLPVGNTMGPVRPVPVVTDPPATDPILPIGNPMPPGIETPNPGPYPIPIGNTMRPSPTPTPHMIPIGNTMRPSPTPTPHFIPIGNTMAPSPTPTPNYIPIGNTMAPSPAATPTPRFIPIGNTMAPQATPTPAPTQTPGQPV